MLAKGHKDSSLEILITNTTVMVKLVHHFDEGYRYTIFLDNSSPLSSVKVCDSVKEAADSASLILNTLGIKTCDIFTKEVLVDVMELIDMMWSGGE